MVTPEVILSMEGVTKVYGSGYTAVTALDDVRLQVRAGEVVLVMGPSGSGKTTLLTIAGALLRPTRGRVHICDTDITGMNEGRLASIRREKVGFVYQSFNLLEALTAMENVRLVTTDGVPKGAMTGSQPKDLLEMLGLGHRLNSLPKHLSDGEKQRVAIARALAKEPRIVLADEPTGNLDEERERSIMELMKSLQDELGMTFFIVSHNQRLRAYMDRTLELRGGVLAVMPNGGGGE